jgi:hypothetical protein
MHIFPNFYVLCVDECSVGTVNVLLVAGMVKGVPPCVSRMKDIRKNKWSSRHEISAVGVRMDTSP